jgi:hypothetical protein
MSASSLFDRIARNGSMEALYACAVGLVAGAAWVITQRVLQGTLGDDFIALLVMAMLLFQALAPLARRRAALDPGVSEDQKRLIHRDLGSWWRASLFALVVVTCLYAANQFVLKPLFGWALDLAETTLHAYSDSFGRLR